MLQARALGTIKEAQLLPKLPTVWCRGQLRQSKVKRKWEMQRQGQSEGALNFRDPANGI